MGDSTEFEKLTVLEARLAAALDRIAVGLGETQSAPEPVEDPGLTSAALEDAQIRADAAEARVSEMGERIAALEGQVAAAASVAAPEPLITPEGLTALRLDLETQTDRAKGLEAAREADADEGRRALAAKDEEMSELRATLSELEQQVQRLRAENSETAAAPTTDPAAESLRAELHDLRQANEDLTEALNSLRAGQPADAATLNQALVVELAALRTARASEAAELERILIDIETAPAASPENGHA